MTLDNPPAFPRTGEGVNASDTHPRYDCPGMSLRDWFAGQALAAYIPVGLDCPIDEIAHDAYRIADAMLAARKDHP